MTVNPSTYPPPGPQPGLYPIPPRKPPARWLRWLLLLAVVLPSTLTVLLTPVQVSPAKLLSDLQSGEVQKMSLSCAEAADDGPTFIIGSTILASDSLCWTDGTLLYRTTLAALRGAISAQQGNRVDVVGTVRATAAAAGQPKPPMVDDRLPGRSTFMTLLAFPYVAAIVATIVLLVTGPQPRFMTKWGVFWTLWLPLEAGLFWWLFYEAPWAARARAMPEPAGPEVRRTYDGRPRRGGGQMFLWLFLAGLVWSLLTAGVEEALDAVLEPAGHAGIWTVQLTSGSDGSSAADLGADICAYFPEDC